jgi:RNA polymerase sigma-70 factor (ECF subfamily)
VSFSYERRGGALEKTDDALVQEAMGGQLGSFDELMRRYQRLVCKVAMNYVKDKQNALDVTQNVFLKVYGHLDSIKTEGMFKPWLLRITYNESINWIRRTKRHDREEVVEDFESTAAPQATQEDAVLDRENKRRLLEGFGALNPKYRLAVSLRYAEGMRIREIAEVMDCSEGMVKSLLFRGVRKIKAEVEKAV